MHLKYFSWFYKYHLCSKKSSEELLWAARCTWHQNDLLSSPCDRDAVTSRICSWPDGELVQMLTRRGDTHLWAQGGALGTRRLSYSGCQEGGSGESLSQHKLLSLNSWQDTGTSLMKNSSSHEQEKVGGQIRELEATPCVICPVLSCSQRFSATMQVCISVTIYI